MSTQDYRARIYARYATRFQDAKAQFDHSASARWGRAYRHYFREWLPLNREARIVDLACGGGKLVHFFKSHGYINTIGVDISPEQVALARQVPAQIELANALEFLEANPNYFDLITALDLVEHFHKPEVLRFLDGCAAALRPGGRLILQTPNADSPWGTTHRYNDFTHEAAFTEYSIGQILGLAGFEDINVYGNVTHINSSWKRALFNIAAKIIAAMTKLILAYIYMPGSRQPGIMTTFLMARGKNINKERA